MPEPDPLAAELDELWRAGEVALPTMAVVYGEAARSLHATALNDAGAFSGGQGSGRFASSWQHMRNWVQDRILATTAENLIETGETLKIIAVNYSHDDSATAAEFERLIDRLPDRPLDQPPDIVPDPPRTHDPHPEPPRPGH